MALKDGLVRAYVPWLGASGGRLIDRSNARNHATLSSMDPGTDWTAATVNGLSGTVLDFDGTNDTVTATTTQSLTTYPFTLSSWASNRALPASLYHQSLSVGTGTSNYFAVGFVNVSGNLRAGIIGRNTTFTQSNSTVNRSLNTWYHIVGVFESATSRKLYVNGVLDHTGTTSVTELANGTGVRIGSQFATHFFNGQIAEGLIYNRVLPDAEIAQLYQLGPGTLFRPQPRRLGFVPVTGGQTINANLFTNTNTFYNATVTAGAVNISANLLTNTSTFYDATISSGTANINANLLTNTSTFYNATVTAGAVTISADLLSNANTFYNAVVSIGDTIVADLYTNNSTIYNAVITAGAVNISANLLTNTATIYLPTVTQLVDTIVADRLNNTSIIYLPTLTGGSTAPTDTSDILTKVSDKRKRRKLQQQLEEENIAAQILKSRQGKQQKAEEPKKAFEIKIKTKQEEVVLATPEIEKPATVELSQEQVQDIQNAVTQFKIKQNNNKKIQTLLFLASTLDD
jgi:hypothetical protein